MIVCLDANCVIYLVEKNPTWGPKVAARLAALRAAGHLFAVTDLARTECLAGPLPSPRHLVRSCFRAFRFSSPDSRSSARYFIPNPRVFVGSFLDL